MTKHDEGLHMISPAKQNKTMFKSRRRLTRPILQITQSCIYTLQVTGEMYKKSLPVSGKQDTDIETTMIDCINQDNGEECMLICNAIIESAFERCTPPLKGRFFELQIGDIRAGKRYRDVDIYELEPQSADPAMGKDP